MTPLDIFSLGRPATRAEMLAYIEERALEARRYFPTFDSPLLRGLDYLTIWLSAMHEPPLAAVPGVREAYRFLWLRSFHRPVCVRITLGGAEAWIRTVALELRPRGGPGDLRLERERILSRDEEATFRRALHAASFWTTPTNGGSSGLDGASWYLEGVREHQHHMVQRWSPDRRGDEASFRDLCEQMLMMSEAGDEIYPIY